MTKQDSIYLKGWAVLFMMFYILAVALSCLSIDIAGVEMIMLELFKYVFLSFCFYPVMV